MFLFSQQTGGMDSRVLTTYKAIMSDKCSKVVYDMWFVTLLFLVGDNLFSRKIDYALEQFDGFETAFDSYDEDTQTLYIRAQVWGYHVSWRLFV